ncbi:hypothetical protein ACIQNU_06155 [Streptomyces sp. NPDC091292]|uniref:hypothetical protein n=1 Tax=Streptomyces sp. NPDC091292 TaxID=3365991 RepID=UPI00380314F3
MTNFRFRDSAPLDLEGGLASLRGDCARMAPHWRAPHDAAPRPVPSSFAPGIHGVVVPAASAKLLDAMSEYGD